ncbi:Uncharacterised protein [Mycobacteroides abscessus subsp. abscessus]|nr:Uncharacterised protein [Mycobacteroides abscessus subsp. abscessus]
MSAVMASRVVWSRAVILVYRSPMPWLGLKPTLASSLRYLSSTGA